MPRHNYSSVHGLKLFQNADPLPDVRSKWIRNWINKQIARYKNFAVWHVNNCVPARVTSPQEHHLYFALPQVNSQFIFEGKCWQGMVSLLELRTEGFEFYRDLFKVFPVIRPDRGPVRKSTLLDDIFDFLNLRLIDLFFGKHRLDFRPGCWCAYDLNSRKGLSIQSVSRVMVRVPMGVYKKANGAVGPLLDLLNHSSGQRGKVARVDHQNAVVANDNDGIPGDDCTVGLGGDESVNFVC